MSSFTSPVHVIDYHTGGEPFRIVPEPGDIPGETVLARRESALTGPADRLRQFLVNEPRGHADMYGGLIVPPDDAGAHFGVLFWHKDGFSTACGHGTIALGAWAVRSGLVEAPADGLTDVVIDVPSGRVTARVHTLDSQVADVTFRNVAARLVARDVAVDTADFETLEVDLVWGGALYATVPAGAAGLRVEPSYAGRLIEFGRQVKAGLTGHPACAHPGDPRLSGLYGTIIHEPAEPIGADLAYRTGADVAQRNVTIFADGQLDRSPCGSGTSARVAGLTERGELAPGARLDHFSIVGSHFRAVAVDRTAEGLITEVTGTAHRVGEAAFALDPDDELGLGFVLR